MKRYKSKYLLSTAISISIAAAAFCCPLKAYAYEYSEGDNSVKVGGWLRNWTGFNLDKVPGSEMKNKWWDPAMIRNELLLDVDAKTGKVGWKFIGRYDREVKTDYLSRLNSEITNQSPNGLSGNGNFMNMYNTTQFLEAAREFYTTFDAGDRINFRLGKQQIVWGESDFFHAMDIISGFDYRQRLFFENNEEYRKPLIMAKANINIPEVNGNLDLFIRPSLDPGSSIGNSYDLQGGRWAVTPYQGVDFTSFTQYNYHAAGADKNDPTYGARWKGEWNEIGYSLAYIKTFNPDPVINPSGMNSTLSAFGVTSTKQWGGQTSNQILGDWVYPEIHAFGGTANYYLDSLDAVFNIESVYVPNKPYNFGQLKSSLPGWGGIIEKDTQVSMLRVDKNINLQNLLGTNRPSLSSFQAFDTWLLNFKSTDQIVQFASMGLPQHEHSTMLTYFIVLNYFGDTVNPSFVVGVDASNGGGFLIPAVDISIGDNWRLKFEADLFWDNHSKSNTTYNANTGVKSNPLGISENQTGLFGWFHGDDQFVARVTRQF